MSGTARTYCFSLTDTPANFAETVDALVLRVRSVLGDVVSRHGGSRVVDAFVVGKSSLHPLPSAPAGAFDPRNRRHVDVQHVAGRWRKKYAPEGFVVAAVTHADVPPGVLANGITLQHYILALEQAVTHRFALVDCDARVRNATFCTGKLEERGAPAYVVYVAFKTARLEPVSEPAPLPVSDPVPLVAAEADDAKENARPPLEDACTPPPRRRAPSPVQAVGVAGEAAFDFAGVREALAADSPGVFYDADDGV